MSSAVSLNGWMSTLGISAYHGDGQVLTTCKCDQGQSFLVGPVGVSRLPGWERMYAGSLGTAVSNFISLHINAGLLRYQGYSENSHVRRIAQGLILLHGGLGRLPRVVKVSSLVVEDFTVRGT